MAPTTALSDALDAAEANEDFARLPGVTRVLVTDTILAFGREALLHGNGAADQAERVIADVTHCQRLGNAAAEAVRKWSRSLG